MALGDSPTNPVPWKQNDTRPALRYQAKQGDPASPIDITGSTVVFNMRLSAAPGTVVANRAASTVINGPSGIMQFVPTLTQTATNGTYISEFEVTLPDGGVFTVPPGDQYIYIKVSDDIA